MARAYGSTSLRDLGLRQRQRLRPKKVWTEAGADAQFATESAAERGYLFLPIADLDRAEMEEVIGQLLCF